VAPPGARRLRFSISHADGVALCAVAAACDVGADVESLRNIGPDPLGVADTVCSRRERCALRALPACARGERLLSIWTVKEAVAKATGLGFHLPLAHITVHGDGAGPPAVEFDTEAGEDASRWRLASLRLAPWHCAAVAVRGARGDDLTIRFAEFLPGR
jgi:4'-phosphopantetheinyl transferase